MERGYPNSGQKRSICILSWFFFFLTIVAYHHALAEQPIIEGFVTKVSDGDTIQVTTNNQTKITIRLSGIDCPEIAKINHKTGKISKPGQPFSQEAHEYMVHLAMRKQVKIVAHGRDQYHRLLGIIFYNDRDVNLELVKTGLAEVYRGNGAIKAYRNELEKAEKEARDNLRGMWILGEKYESPAKFRKRMNIRGG